MRDLYLTNTLSRKKELFVPVHPGHVGMYVCGPTVYGIPFGVGIVFATLSHESQTLTMILCGTASYIDETVRLRKNAD